ncbi:MAG: tyrosine-type recombinase/integrase family protein [Clostridia bacterium]|nr:tyrosine-type recombinase/integrase family protein [Clostridia bacterium]
MPRPKKQAPNRADGRYQYALTIGTDVNGKRVRKYFYSSKSIADAKAMAEEWKVSQQVSEITGTDLTGSTVNFGKWANVCLESIKGTVRNGTYFNTYYNNMVNHVIPYFGKMNLSDVQPVHIEAFFKLKNKTHATDSQKKMLRCLNLVFKKGLQNHKCYHNPCTDIKITKKPPAQKSVYTAEQAQKILNYTYQHPLGFSVRLLLRYGFSRSELLGIVPSRDFDPLNNTLHICSGVTIQKNPDTEKHELVSDAPKTAYRDRLVPIHPDDAAILSEMAAKPGFAFSSQKGTPLNPSNWFSRVYKVFMRDMREHYLAQQPPEDIPILNPHELRHTRTSLWVNDDKNLFAIASVLGWGDLKMLRQRYAHPDIDRLRSNLDL